jgi:methionyl aminopeptidase
MNIILKSKDDLVLMRQAGKIVGLTYEALKNYIKPGISAWELDKIAEEFIFSQGATPAYMGLYGFPATICISFNEEVVHGIPTKRVLKDGDLVKIDVGVTYKGYNGDSCLTFPVGKVSPQAEKLTKVAHDACLNGIAAARHGRNLLDIGHAIADVVEPHGFGIVRQYVGHGIGKRVHEDPQVYHYRVEKEKVKEKDQVYLRKGTCLTVEPMINLGTWDTYVKPDKWTVKTSDGSLSAQFEHSIAITDGEPEILTLS